MSLLTLVRHGQASFFANDYDQLSEVGENQSRLLGTHWGKQALTIDEVYAGPRRRQQKSAELAGMAYQESGFTWPEPIVLDELDEYDLDGLTNHFAPRLAEQHAEFARLVEGYRRSDSEPDQLRSFQRMFETLLSHWQKTEAEDANYESWIDFRQRVRRVIHCIQDRPGRSRRVVLFTSGGFIGTAVQLALGATDQTALELNWRIRNSSLTEFVFTQDRLSLDGFNMIPHLHDPTMWTYR
jgi:broad specificity phosphatase PhoE